MVRAASTLPTSASTTCANTSGANDEEACVLVAGPGSALRASGGDPGTAFGISPHPCSHRERPVHVSAGLPDAVGPDRDHGHREDVAESLRAARLAGPRCRASLRVRRPRDGTLRPGRRAAG